MKVLAAVTIGFSKQMGFEQALEVILITGITDIPGEIKYTTVTWSIELEANAKQVSFG